MAIHFTPEECFALMSLFRQYSAPTYDENCRQEERMLASAQYAGHLRAAINKVISPAAKIPVEQHLATVSAPAPAPAVPTPLAPKPAPKPVAKQEDKKVEEKKAETKPAAPKTEPPAPQTAPRAVESV